MTIFEFQTLPTFNLFQAYQTLIHALMDEWAVQVTRPLFFYIPTAISQNPSNELFSGTKLLVQEVVF